MIGLLLIYFLHITVLVNVLKETNMESGTYKFVSSLIFRSYLIEGDRVTKKLIQADLKTDSVQFTYLIGVIGDGNATKHLEGVSRKLVETDNGYKAMKILASMNALSLTYHPETVKLLEQLLNLQKSNNKPRNDIYFSTNWIIARCLYILTGKRYTYIGKSNDSAKVPITMGLKMIRDVVTQTQPLKRNLDQMEKLLALTLPIKKANSYYKILEQ